MIFWLVFKSIPPFEYLCMVFKKGYINVFNYQYNIDPWIDDPIEIVSIILPTLVKMLKPFNASQVKGSSRTRSSTA